MKEATEYIAGDGPACRDDRHPDEDHAGLIWSIADPAAGDYKQSEYGRDHPAARRPAPASTSVLEPTNATGPRPPRRAQARLENVGPVLQAITGIEARQHVAADDAEVLRIRAQAAGNLRAWMPPSIERRPATSSRSSDFDAQIGRLDRARLLYLVLSEVTEVDLQPRQAPATSRWATSSRARSGASTSQQRDAPASTSRPARSSG
ncbi:MAG: hypothetical protein WKF78_02795 [Candidatus Limnocylindrales bacterium]